jgi:RimJ/RimL family protein N-acetyltransferase
MKKDRITIHVSQGMTIRIVTSDDTNQDYYDTLRDHNAVRYMVTNHQKHDFSSIKEYVTNQLYTDNNNYLFGLYKDDYLMATSRVHDIEKGNAWQGILVFKKFQGQGNGHSLVANVSDYILKNFELSSVSAGILKENVISKNLFRSCGFIHRKDDPHYEGRQIWIKERV